MAVRPVENSLQALLAARFHAQAQMIAALTDHPVLVGTGRENAVGALLQELLPRRFEVLTGVIAQLDDKGRPRRAGAQADIMVVDTLDFPVLLRMGSTAVVVPDAVQTIIEVKSSLARPPRPVSADAAEPHGIDDTESGASEANQTFLDALVQIGKLRLAIPDGGGSVRTVLLSYGAPVFPKRLREWLELSLAARGSMRPGSDEYAALSSFMLPDIILSVPGAIARKTTARTYQFFRCPSDGTKDGSAVIETIQLLLGAISANIAGDSTRVQRGFDYVRSYLATTVAPAEGCLDLSIA
ncbi:MAG: DUF6602 domain-containing protein [Polyangiales bacterium]